MSFNALYLTIFTLLAVYFYRKKKMEKKNSLEKKSDFINTYPFPSRVYTTLQKTYPHLVEEEIEEIIQGLRDYFYICTKANKKMVSMPSQAVDEAWHAFILFTKLYESFCQKAFGKFLHHHPAEAMKTPTDAQKGIQLAWRIACQKENISYYAPLKLPNLFSIDSRLKIENGFTYSLNCTKEENNTNIYCATHILDTKTYQHVTNYSSSTSNNTHSTDYSTGSSNHSSSHHSSNNSSSNDSNTSGCGGGCGGD